MHPMTISLEQDFLFGSNSDQACSDILMPQHPFLSYARLSCSDELSRLDREILSLIRISHVNATCTEWEPLFSRASSPLCEHGPRSIGYDLLQSS